ncbi:hypothetical protein TL16_g01936 [Triparma laevis f. inornata]|uniref:Kinesin light chain n=1 Tax=Triparma laevis f. inornata TaxID=1714386 RepID=A0A9W6ZJA3_9STRA|nr:hypothetical protein TL16_g01936 [Triparma laevis f. inornata]
MASFTGSKDFTSDPTHNNVSGPIQFFDTNRDSYRSVLGWYDGVTCGLRTYDIVTGMATLRPKSIINVFSITDGTSCEGDGNSSKKNRIEIHSHIPDNTLSGTVMGALATKRGAQSRGGLWSKVKKEISHETSYLAFENLAEMKLWYSAMKLSLLTSTDCLLLFMGSSIESSIQWIDNCLAKLNSANVTKVGAIGMTFKQSVAREHEMDTRTPQDALENIVERFDQNGSAFDNFISEVAKSTSTSGFVKPRKSNFEVREHVDTFWHSDPLKAVDIFKASFICSSSSQILKVFNALKAGSTKDKSVSWTMASVENMFSPNYTQKSITPHSHSTETLSKYRSLKCYVSVSLPSSSYKITLEIQIHLESLLRCIRSSIDGDKGCIGAYVETVFPSVEHELEYRVQVYETALINAPSENNIILRSGTTMDEIRPHYLKEIRYIYEQEIALRYASFNNLKDKETTKATYDLVLGKILKKHHLTTGNNRLLEDEALPLFESAEALRANHLGRSHPLTLIALNSYGILCRKLKKYDLAEELYTRSLHALEKNLGKNDRKTAACCHNLGMVYYLKGMHDKSVEYLRRDYEVLQKSLGDAHADTRGSIEHLVKVMEGKPLGMGMLNGYEEEVVTLKNKKVKGEAEAYGTGSVEYLYAINSVAENHIVTGEAAEAAVALEDAIDEYKRQNKQMKIPHQALLVCMNNLGIALAMEEDHHGACKAYKQCAGGYVQNTEFGLHHVSTAMVMNNLGMTFAALGDNAQATGTYTRALGGLLPYVQNLGDSHSDNDTSKAFVGKASKRTSTRQGIPGSRGKKLPPKSEDEIREIQDAIAVLRSNIATVTEDLNEKCDLYRWSLATVESKQGRNHPDVCFAAQNLALALHARAKTEDDAISAVTKGEVKQLAMRLVGSYSKHGQTYCREVATWKNYLKKYG